jgi:uncharacterized membrane protein HdeD (DUF308 family)
MRPALPELVVPAPTARIGRHLRRAARRVALLGAVAVALALALLAAAPPVAASIALVVAVVVVALGLCRLVAAHDADTREERWLRHVLGALRADRAVDEDEDPGLLVS